MDAVAAADVAAMVPMSAEKGAITDTKTIITMKVIVLIVINKIGVRLRDAPVNEAAKTQLDDVALGMSDMDHSAHARLRSARYREGA